MSVVKFNFKNYSESEIEKIMNDCEKYRSQLVEYCCKFFECEHENAKDCVQEAYASLLESLKSGAEISNYKSFLYSASLSCKDKIIKEKSMQNEYDFFDNAEKDSAINEVVFNELDFESEIIDDLIIEEMALNIVSKLDFDDKELFISYYWKNKKLKEIADEMGITYANVRKRHQSLKKKIRQIAVENGYL